jgi:C-terminal processing protease CtpA/Prc
VIQFVIAFTAVTRVQIPSGTPTLYKVGQGYYILGLPVAAYLTWQGRMLENNGIVPRFGIVLSRDALREGRDTQLETATELAKTL